MRTPFRIAIALVIVSALLYTANLVVYEGLALALGLTATYQLVTLGLVLGLLAASFIGMMILGSYYYNVFTRSVYATLATWMGAFGNLFFASTLYGLVVGGATLLNVALPVQPVGITIFTAALLVSIYGVWHAKQITVANYTVTLPNLPIEWKSKRALWMSDLHLGQI